MAEQNGPDQDTVHRMTRRAFLKGAGATAGLGALAYAEQQTRMLSNIWGGLVDFGANVITRVPQTFKPEATPTINIESQTVERIADQAEAMIRASATPLGELSDIYKPAQYPGPVRYLVPAEYTQLDARERAAVEVQKNEVVEFARGIHGPSPRWLDGVTTFMIGDPKLERDQQSRFTNLDVNQAIAAIQLSRENSQTAAYMNAFKAALKARLDIRLVNLRQSKGLTVPLGLVRGNEKERFNAVSTPVLGTELYQGQDFPPYMYVGMIGMTEMLQILSKQKGPLSPEKVAEITKVLRDMPASDDPNSPKVSDYMEKFDSYAKLQTKPIIDSDMPDDVRNGAFFSSTLAMVELYNMKPTIFQEIRKQCNTSYRDNLTIPSAEFWLAAAKSSLGDQKYKEWHDKYSPVLSITLKK